MDRLKTKSSPETQQHNRYSKSVRLAYDQSMKLSLKNWVQSMAFIHRVKHPELDSVRVMIGVAMIFIKKDWRDAEPVLIAARRLWDNLPEEVKLIAFEKSKDGNQRASVPSSWPHLRGKFLQA